MKKYSESQDRNRNVILVPVDFSRVTENAVVHGLELARLLRYRVCLLHVMADNTGKTQANDASSLQNRLGALQEYKERYEPEFAVKIDTMIRAGNLFKVFNAAVSELRPKLMVMGTHGKQGLQHLFGSHALRVVLDARCPLLIVQDRPFGFGASRIVLPINSEADPFLLKDWLLLFCKMFNPEMHLYQSVEEQPERISLVKSQTSQIAGILKAKKVAHIIAGADSPNDFPDQLLRYMDSINPDLIMAMAHSSADKAGFNVSEWYERLMFNPGQIPVLFVRQIDLPR